MSPISQSAMPEIPDYEILHRIGAGGMGEVFLARQRRPKRTVAIKVMTPLPHAALQEQRLRFEREVRLVEQFAHPNLATVFDHGSASGRDFFVMEYVEGTTRRSFMQPRRSLDLPCARWSGKALELTPDISKRVVQSECDLVRKRASAVQGTPP